MDKIRQDPNAKVHALIEDRALPIFVRCAAERALSIDCVEAANGFRMLADIFVARAEALTGVSILPANRLDYTVHLTSPPPSEVA